MSVLIKNPTTVVSGGIRVQKLDENASGTTVPNSGVVNNVYFNKYLSEEQVIQIIQNANFETNEYFVLKTSDETENISIFHWVEDLEGWAILHINSETSLQEILWCDENLFSLFGNVPDFNLTHSGWQDFTNPILINKEVSSDVGTLNESLKDIISITEYAMSVKEVKGVFDGETLQANVGSEYFDGKTVDVEKMLDSKKLPLNIDVENAKIKVDDTEIDLIGEYDGTPIEITENGTLELEPLILENKLPLNVEVNVAGSGGIELNVHYGLEAPTDTSKLWVKTETIPSKVISSNELNTANVNNNVNDYELTKLETQLPIGLWGMAHAKVGNNIYLFGGEETNTSGGTQNYIYKFNTETETVSTLSTAIPHSRTSGIAAATIGTKIYLFGGYSNSTVYIFDSETETITSLITISSFKSQRSMSSGVIGTKIYFLAVRNGNSASNYIYMFDIETETMTTLSVRLPVANYDAGYATIGTKIYLFSGDYDSKIYMFDSETETIKAMNDIGSKYSGIMCGAIGTKIYGFYNTTIYVYDTLTDNLETITMSESVGKKGCAEVINDKIYIFGSNTSDDVDNGKNIRTFIPTAKIIILPFNNLLLYQNALRKKYKLINTDTLVIENNTSTAFLGDANNEGQMIKIALYNEETSNWEEIN